MVDHSTPPTRQPTSTHTATHMHGCTTHLPLRKSREPLQCDWSVLHDEQPHTRTSNLTTPPLESPHKLVEVEVQKVEVKDLMTRTTYW